MTKQYGPLLHRIEHIPPLELRPYARNARTHSRKQVKAIARSIETFGFMSPVLAGDDGEIIAGHGRVEAAKLLGMQTVPVIRIGHFSDAERRAYILADNKLALQAGWDQEILAIEFQALIDLGFEAELTGFSTTEIDLTFELVENSDPKAKTSDLDRLPTLRSEAVTAPGDVWDLGRHRLICGDARDGEAHLALMQGDLARLAFTDPPYNLPVENFVSGGGKVRHGDFQMGVGEMTRMGFIGFLTAAFEAIAAHSVSGAIIFVCMDWRHGLEVQTAGEAVFAELKNLICWVKSNAGMGNFYRSQYEHVYAFKHGDAPHVNNFGLGGKGRYRTNVWKYDGVSGFSLGRDEALAAHPTVKPVAMVADAIKDCSHRNDIILDPFGGSGTTLIAAETTGRTCRMMEIDPRYCDVILRRYQALTGKAPVLAATGETFDLVEDNRIQRGAA